MTRTSLAIAVALGFASRLTAADYSAELVFPLHPQHNHAPGIAECPNGDLLVSWYRGSGERSADDVAVYGARLKSGAAAWSEAFLLADTPGFPDCNTALFVDAQKRLRLFWPVILFPDTNSLLRAPSEAAALTCRHESRRLD